MNHNVHLCSACLVASMCFFWFGCSSTKTAEQAEPHHILRNEVHETRSDIAYQLTISCAIERPTVGQPLPIQLRLKNTGDDVFYVISSTNPWNCSLAYHGTPIAMTEEGLRIFSEIQSLRMPIPLNPGQHAEIVFDLTRLFNISRSGQYHLVVSRDIVPSGASTTIQAEQCYIINVCSAENGKEGRESSLDGR